MPDASLSFPPFRLDLSELSGEKEAQAAVMEILRFSPHFSMENIAQRLPYKDPAAVECTLAALRKAGLK